VTPAKPRKPTTGVQKRLPPSPFGIDGIARTPSAEQELNLLAASTFNTPGAQRLLDYLKSITINMVQGPGVTSDELRHIEGQRYIVGILEQRIKHGRERR